MFIPFPTGGGPERGLKKLLDNFRPRFDMVRTARG